MKLVITGTSGGIGSVIKQAFQQLKIDIIEVNSKNINLKHPFTINEEVDGLIHCAGINKILPYNLVSRFTAQPIMDVNTFSFIEMCSQLKFRPNSNIIAIGSLYATETKEGRIQYTMSKHALYGAVKTLAIEMAPHKINMISPGFVDTDLTRQNNSKERIAYLDQVIPLGLTDPWEIANLCVYLITKNNSITGQNLIIDGGYSLIGI